MSTRCSIHYSTLNLAMDKDDPVIASSDAMGDEEFNKLCNMLRRQRIWKFVLLELGSIARELEGRLDAIEHNRDYVKVVSEEDRALTARLVEYAQREQK